ncbi:anti-sigma factor family protein [Amycolatopsis echigonensis]|uniref:anti-sigma factor family protein n=1 Tax=Amycolatopsis echigonensis TaxID=2576905 RepID=UPI001C818A3D|nr:zf-HC2 domain-containing protein [Amycolatopsis echigonensis]
MTKLFERVGPSPVRCLRVMRLLQSYLDGEVTDATAARIAEHLEECRRCGLQADTYLAIKNALAHRQPPTTDAVDRLRAFGEALLHTADEPDS